MDADVLQSTRLNPQLHCSRPLRTKLNAVPKLMFKVLRFVFVIMFGTIRLCSGTLEGSTKKNRMNVSQRLLAECCSELFEGVCGR